MKIFLIGMPGSGKTTLGRQLAERLQIDFVDLDEEIEKTESLTIPEIFASRGHDYFRAVESKLLRAWAAKQQPFVMSTGGGAPCFFDGISVINEHGISVFLDWPVDILFNRVRSDSNRPLLETDNEAEVKKRLRAMHAERLPCYQQAKVVLREPTLEMLLSMLEPRR